MSVNDLVQIRLSELQQIQMVLQADQRIVAAWLFGSEGRRTSDVLSDLDVWVAGGAYLMALYPGQAGLHQAWAAVSNLERLRELADEMKQLTSAIELIGGQVPSRAIPYVYDFFDLADALIQQA